MLYNSRVLIITFVCHTDKVFISTVVWLLEKQVQERPCFIMTEY